MGNSTNMDSILDSSGTGDRGKVEERVKDCMIAIEGLMMDYRNLDIRIQEEMNQMEEKAKGLFLDGDKESCENLLKLIFEKTRNQETTNMKRVELGILLREAEASIDDRKKDVLVILNYAVDLEVSVENHKSTLKKFEDNDFGPSSYDDSLIQEKMFVDVMISKFKDNRTNDVEKYI